MRAYYVPGYVTSLMTGTYWLAEGARHGEGGRLSEFHRNNQGLRRGQEMPRGEGLVYNRRVGRLTEPQALPEGSRRIVNQALKSETVLQEKRRMGRD